VSSSSISLAESNMRRARTGACEEVDDVTLGGAEADGDAVAEDESSKATGMRARLRPCSGMLPMPAPAACALSWKEAGEAAWAGAPWACAMTGSGWRTDSSWELRGELAGGEDLRLRESEASGCCVLRLWLWLVLARWSKLW
jgi:hypothetical protein